MVARPYESRSTSYPAHLRAFNLTVADLHTYFDGYPQLNVVAC